MMTTVTTALAGDAPAPLPLLIVAGLLIAYLLTIGVFVFIDLHKRKK